LATKRDTWLARLCSRRLGLHPGLDLAGHGEKGLFDIGGSLCRCLEEFNAKAVGKLLALFGGDDTLGRQIRLVAHQELVDVFAGVPVNFVQPLLYVVEGFVISDIIDDNNAVGTAVVRRCNGTETLLSGRVPNLKFDCLAIEFNGADFLNGGKEKKSENDTRHNAKHTPDLCDARLTKSTPIVEM
jgi:hypothetical protein